MRQREENDQPAPIGECSQVVEILMQDSMRYSYDVDKDGIEVAVSTLLYRRSSSLPSDWVIREVVELNDRPSQLVQCIAHLKMHESPPIQYLLTQC
ncbi:hypothetical protein F5878DRAFT_393274 [Lentinula raphanica]|uniref:Uncharacterized protein n=1 Tax=Lentinula raphanica TaxID=153919 RepID=A0AA38P006_9AGAR|nr:hypothetical protein F5878DRAFT_393274 [Lentinula raphanica]